MWLYEGKEIDSDAVEEYVGFVYRITNLINGKQYIGKKLFKSTQRKKVKGKTRRKVVRKESNWRDYFGSNGTLQEDVKNHGPENFKREILKLCTSKGTCNYWEAKYQMMENVLEDENYYNEWIILKVHKSHIKS